MSSQAEGAGWRRPDGSAGADHGHSKSARLVDPEDDLPSATYTGDFETTTIPPYDPAGSRVVGTDYSLIGDQQPLPYVQPQSGGRNSAKTGHADSDDHPFRPADRRGTQDLGLLILRVCLGVLLVAHGLQKLFGWWGGQGLTGFRHTLSDVGYQHADILTYVAAGGLIAAGLLLVLGLFTPLAAAGALAYLLNAVLAGVSAQTDHRLSFFLPGDHEYQLMLVVVAVAIVLAGPGRYGLDGDRGWARRPFIGSFAALLLGIGGGTAMWVLLNGANPLA
ncbi:MAG TPA: DoxX family protein [Mycobacterium sp.]|nr:DoxX family protein [Mycobacterium sp.]